MKTNGFQTLDLVEGMQKDSKVKIKEMKIDGGMVSNEKFNQSLANILQIKIIKPQNTETTALGAAYLAGLNCGLIKNFNEISSRWKSKQIYQPKMSKKTINKELAKIFGRVPKFL